MNKQKEYNPRELFLVFIQCRQNLMRRPKAVCTHKKKGKSYWQMKLENIQNAAYRMSTENPSEESLLKEIREYQVAN